MKKVLSFALSIVLCFFVCGCAISDADIIRFLDEMSSGNTIQAEQMEKTLEKCVASENFPELLQTYINDRASKGEFQSVAFLLNNLTSLGFENVSAYKLFDDIIISRLDGYFQENKLDEGFSLLMLLSDSGYVSEYIKEDFSASLGEIRVDIFSGSDPQRVIEYIELVKRNLDGNDYTSIIECFPYNEMVTYIESKGNQVIVENNQGGYYDDIQDQFANEEYWYSPLDGKQVSRGSIGTYQQTLQYEFYGDLMIKATKRYWYKTDYSDPNNTTYSELYYKGEYVGNDTTVAVWPLVWCLTDPEMTLAVTGEDIILSGLYSMEGDDGIMLVGVGVQDIHIIYNGQMVTIAYE